LQTTPAQRSQVIDPFRKYIEGWVDESHGRVRADVVQDKLAALGLGYAGSERTIRRAVAEAKVALPGWPAAAVSAVVAGAGDCVPVGPWPLTTCSFDASAVLSTGRDRRDRALRCAAGVQRRFAAERPLYEVR